MGWWRDIIRKLVARDAQVQKLPVNKAVNEAAAKVLDPLVK